MSHDPATVRRLRPSDLAAVAGMLDLFGAAFGEPETYGARRPDAAYLTRLLGRETVVALVAETDGRVVGALVAYELEKFEQPRSEFYVYDLAVDVGHRRQGIATALLADLRKIAATRGGWVIFVQADPGDAPAIALYSGLGSREEVLHFDLPVGLQHL